MNIEHEIVELKRRVAQLEARATGVQGTIAVVDETVAQENHYSAYVTPKTENGARVRNSPTTVSADNFLYILPFGGYRKVVGGIDDYNDPKYRWYILDDDSYVRMDVVTLEWHDKTPMPRSKWPAPVASYTVTNRHGVNGHAGVDLACARGTPVYAAHAPGVVVKTFYCTKCSPNGDRGDFGASKGSGYGTFAIVRYAWGADYAFVMYAHLSALLVAENQELTGMLGGSAIGRVGATGNTYGNPPDHLHVEVRLSADMHAKWGTLVSTGVDPLTLFAI